MSADHTVYWTPSGLTLRCHHDTTVDTGNGWTGDDPTIEQIEAIEAATLDRRTADMSITEYLEESGPLECDGEWYGWAEGDVYRVATWCGLAQWDEYGLDLEEVVWDVGTLPDSLNVPIYDITEHEWDGGCPKISGIATHARRVENGPAPATDETAQ